jgi:hypothetical protein
LQINDVHNKICIGKLLGCIFNILPAFKRRWEFKCTYTGLFFRKHSRSNPDTGEGNDFLPLPETETQLLGRPASSLAAIATELSRLILIIKRGL